MLQLTKSFRQADYAAALEAWAWTDLADKTPIFTSLFADVFFASPEGCWFLDTIEGKLSRQWQDQDQLTAALATAEGQEQYLLASLATAAAESGLVPSEREVYDFRTPPILGGALDADNLGLMDFTVALNICGQIHGQVRSLPPGAPIGAITITPP